MAGAVADDLAKARRIYARSHGVAMLRAYLFGGLDLVWDEHPLPALPGGAARSLLAYLLTHRDRPHTRDLLAGTFWPDLPDATARRRLSQALWQIRRLLRDLPAVAQAGSPTPPALLLTAADTVQIHPALPLWLDVEEFTWQYARSADGSPESDESLKCAVRCLDLYRGEFMAGYYDDWIIPERERLRGNLLQLLERQLQGFKGRGEYERALVYARRLVAEDPWREEAHCEVMRLCHLLGRDGEALRQYEACCQVLAAELSTQPSPETAALAAEIAGRAGLPAPALLPAMPRPLRTPYLERPDQLPLAGRRAELAELVRQLESAARGNGGLTIVCGEAGVGKSRLLRELAANAHWRGVRTAWGRCYELAAPPAYQPLVEALHAELTVLSAPALPPPWRRELARLLPELAADGPPPPPLVPQEEASRILEAIARAFLALAAAGPLLLILEDAHWMDTASLEALRYLLPRLDVTPLLIVISARSEELAGQPAALLAAIERTRLPRRIELGRLGLAETAELLQQALDLQQPAPRFSARLYAETEGNPFFLVETLWSLVQEGVLTRDEAGGWSTPWDESTEDYAELPLPASVVQSITRRLERLPPALRDLLHLAAVIGRDVDFRLWLAASGHTEEELLTVGDELCARALLLAPPERRAAPDQAGTRTVAADYTFAHDLIRRVSYERLSAPRRRAYHRRVAEALSLLAPGQPEVLAYHWTQAEVWDQAADNHQRAGDHARSLYANAAAVAHYTQALEYLARLPGPIDPSRRYSLHLTREAVYDLLGEREAQATDLEALTALAETMGDEARQAEVALRRAHYAEVTGNYPEAIKAAQNAIRLAQAGHDVGSEASGYLQWGQALYYLGDYDDARARSEQSLALAQEAQLLHLQAHTLRHLAAVADGQGDYGRAAALLEQALPIYRSLGDSRGEGAILHNLGLVAVARGDHLNAVDSMERALRIYSEVGDRRNEARTLLSLGRVFLQRSDYAGGRAHLQQALSIFRDISDRQSEGWALLNLGRTALLQGDLPAARADCDRAQCIFEEIGVRSGEALALANLGGIYRQQGDYDEATAHLEKALGISREIGDQQGIAWGLHLLADVRADQGDYAQAQVYLEQAGDILRELGDRLSEGWVVADMGLLYHRLGDDEAARQFSQQAVSTAVELDNPLLHSDGLLHLADALARRLPSQATAAYREALALRRRLSAPHLIAEPLAGLARVALAQGDLGQAQRCVEEVVHYLESHAQSANGMHGMEDTDEPFQVFLTCYQVLQAVHDPRAGPILATAHDLLQKRAARITHEELRHSFLEKVSAHREVILAYRDWQASREQRRQITVSLPRVDAPLGRLLHPDEFVAVAWTVHAPEDEAILGKVARRRWRILRLLVEAQGQGAAPCDEDLAKALDVSLVTLRRDMAALRNQGRDLPTRRRRTRKRPSTEK